MYTHTLLNYKFFYFFILNCLNESLKYIPTEDCYGEKRHKTIKLEKKFYNHSKYVTKIKKQN